jgi:hypothetical protein
MRKFEVGDYVITHGLGDPYCGQIVNHFTEQGLYEVWLEDCWSPATLPERDLELDVLKMLAKQ